MKMKCISIIVCVVLCGIVHCALAINLTVPVSMAERGHEGIVAITVDDVSSVSCIDFQLSYDPMLLTFTGCQVQNGTVGDEYELSYTNYDSSVFVSLFTDAGAGVVTGSGELCQLIFRVNEGASPGLNSALTLSQRHVLDAYGGNMQYATEVSHSNGVFWCVLASTNDADSDGLSDYDEQMLNGSFDYVPGEGDTDIDNADTDSDGMPDAWEVSMGLNPVASDAGFDPDWDGLSNMQELEAGTEPKNPDTDFDGIKDGAECIAGTSPVDGDENFCIEDAAYLADSFYLNWSSVTGRRYAVYSTTNLNAYWTPEETNIIGTGGTLVHTNQTPASFMLYYIEVELDQ